MDTDLFRWTNYQLLKSLQSLIRDFKVFSGIVILYSYLKEVFFPKARPFDPLVVYRINVYGISSLAQLRIEPPEDLEELPQVLILERGNYNFQGAFFDCCVPGLYRFSAPGIKSQQSIVLDQSDPVASALFLSLLSIRGNRHDNFSLKKLQRDALRSLISLTCGPNSIFLQRLMSENNFNSRVVYSHTLESINSYNNGHTLLEVYSQGEKKFVVIDVDKKMYFSLEGVPLSLYELCYALYHGNEIKLNKIVEIAPVDWGGFRHPVNGFDYGFIEQSFYFDDESISSCISRICQVPMMLSDDQWYVCSWDENAGKRLATMNAAWVVLSPYEFLQKFYSS